VMDYFSPRAEDRPTTHSQNYCVLFTISSSSSSDGSGGYSRSVARRRVMAVVLVKVFLLLCCSVHTHTTSNKLS
jgi:hypothetical protein